MASEPTILDLALTDGTPTRAAKVALLVGTILLAINQGDVILAGEWPNLWKAGLTYLVPYGVATYGAVTAKRAMLRRGRA
ncbi:MAG: nitrate/nitrite transporter NrtS [Alphaproteobacteria bacterium]